MVREDRYQEGFVRCRCGYPGSEISIVTQYLVVDLQYLVLALAASVSIVIADGPVF